jgi:predicted PurR-regulated permease PerM
MKRPDLKPYVYGMLAGFGAIGLSVAFFFILYRMQGVEEALTKLTDILMPFIYGGVIAYLLRPMCNWYSGKFNEWMKNKRPKLAETLAVTGSLVTGLFVIYLLVIMIAPQLYRNMAALWDTIPEKVDQLLVWATETFGENEVLLRYFDLSYEAIYTTLDNWAQTTLVPQVTSIVTGVGSSIWSVFIFLKNILIGVIVAAYLLASRKKFSRQGVMVIRSLFKPRWADLILEEIAYIDRMFGGFIDGKLVDSAIIGVLCYIGCSIFKFPNALLVSTIVGITNVVPFFGPFLGAIPSVALILIESPIKAVWFALFVLGLQQLDGNVIGPAILGEHTGVSSFWVLFSILLFGGLWGLVGMIIAVPLFAVIYDLLRRLVIRGLAKNDCLDFLRRYDDDYNGGVRPKH